VIFGDWKYLQDCAAAVHTNAANNPKSDTCPPIRIGVCGGDDFLYLSGLVMRARRGRSLWMLRSYSPELGVTLVLAPLVGDAQFESGRT
jgi:hypothetical protein